MKVIKSDQAIKVQAATSTEIDEFDTQNENLGIAVSRVAGRYPESGLAMNERSDEVVYVMNGKGRLLFPGGETEIAAGDVVTLQNQELFAWSGNLTLVMATSPRFNPDQHEIVEK